MSGHNQAGRIRRPARKQFEMTDTARPDTSSDRAGDSDPATPYRYSASLAADIESRWQDRWETEHTFEAPNPAKIPASRSSSSRLRMEVRGSHT